MRFAGTRLSLLQTLIIVGLCLLPLSAIEGQESQVQPPPPKVVAPDEQSQIDDTKDPKERLKLLIKLAEDHLTSAEQTTAHSDFEAASLQVGHYHALIEESLKFLASLNRDRNKTRDLYKKLELALRSQGPRLTALRRITPLEFAVWIKAVEDFARNGRTEALNSFYGHTVVRDQEPTSSKPTDPQRKDNSLVPVKKQ